MKERLEHGVTRACICTHGARTQSWHSCTKVRKTGCSFFSMSWLEPTKWSWDWWMRLRWRSHIEQWPNNNGNMSIVKLIYCQVDMQLWGALLMYIHWIKPSQYDSCRAQFVTNSDLMAWCSLGRIQSNNEYLQWVGFVTGWAPRVTSMDPNPNQPLY